MSAALRRTSAAVAAALSVAGCDREAVFEAEAADCPRRESIALGAARRTLVNAYFLQEEATRAVRQRGSAPPEVLDEVFAEARAMGVGLVRTWAFNDDPAKAGDSAIQVAPLQYDEVAWVGLDWVLARAHHHGVQLILPLGNGWAAYGGAKQYVQWAGLPEAREQDPRFFTDAGVIAHYKAHVEKALTRVSAVDGLRYSDHPAVAAWELLNEPRGDPLFEDGTQLRTWIDDLGAHVKRLAPNQLLGTGEEGQDLPGTVFALNVASPSIDYAGVHLFPESWKWPTVEIPRRGAGWLASRAAIAVEAGKPFVLSEFGLRNDGELDLDVRRAVYRGWLRCAATSGAAAMGPWMFANDARPDEWDRYTFSWRDGSIAAAPGNRYVDVMIDAAALLQ